MTTWNPLDKHASISLSNGDLTAAQMLAGWRSVRATEGRSSGKRYFEVRNDNNYNSHIILGFGPLSLATTTFIGSSVGSYGYNCDGRKFIAGAASAYGAAYTTGDVIGFALDMDAGTLTCYKNGVSQGVLASGLSGTLYPMASLYSSGRQVTVNFGATAFAYSIPDGFSAWDAEAPVELTELVDMRLHLSAYYQSLEDLRLFLMASDGTAWEDLKLRLQAAGWTTEDLQLLMITALQDMQDLPLYLSTIGQQLKDLKLHMAAYGRSIEDLRLLLKAAGSTKQDLKLYLSTVSSTVLKDFMLYLAATDGWGVRDLKLYLSAIRQVPSFQSVIAQRISSVMSEVL
ncbi:MAG: SPRY domain-containing protein [Bacteroidales bacterium]